MQLILHNGDIVDVDTRFIFDDQYNTTDGRRIYDKEVKRIIDDVRLGEFYCCSVKQGSYDEVAQAIADKRSQINQCQSCWWYHERIRIRSECSKSTIREGNKEYINEQTVYEISCAYKPKYGKCAHDIEEAPILFREKNFCFFCEYPDGIPDMTPLRQFMIDNADKYNIVPY